jgi:cytochrome b561
MLRNSTEKYGAVAQLFHWVIVGLIIYQFYLANKAEDLSVLKKIGVLAQHKSIGMTIFALALLRLLWRFTGAVPAVPLNTPPWQRVAAHLSHGALYALIMITPLFGWMMSSARNYSVSWFGFFTFPNLVKPDKATYEFFLAAHGWLAYAIFAVAVLHALAALKHHFVDRDNVLRRMLPGKLRSELKVERP